MVNQISQNRLERNLGLFSSTNIVITNYIYAIPPEDMNGIISIGGLAVSNSLNRVN
jgi:hypothetical protein